MHDNLPDDGDAGAHTVLALTHDRCALKFGGSSTAFSDCTSYSIGADRSIGTDRSISTDSETAYRFENCGKSQVRLTGSAPIGNALSPFCYVGFVATCADPVVVAVRIADRAIESFFIAVEQ